MLDITAMAGAFGDNDLSGAFALAELDGRGHHMRIGVNHLVAMILDDIGLEDDPLSGEWDTLAKSLVLALKNTSQIAVVVADRGDVDFAGSGDLPQSPRRVDSHAPDERFEALAPSALRGWRIEDRGLRKHRRGAIFRSSILLLRFSNSRIQAKNVELLGA